MSTSFFQSSANGIFSTLLGKIDWWSSRQTERDLCLLTLEHSTDWLSGKHYLLLNKVNKNASFEESTTKFHGITLVIIFRHFYTVCCSRGFPQKMKHYLSAWEKKSEITILKASDLIGGKPFSRLESPSTNQARVWWKKNGQHSVGTSLTKKVLCFNIKENLRDKGN